MPRLVPKRAPKADPLPVPNKLPEPPLGPITVVLRARATFTCEGVQFIEGDTHSIDSPLARAIWAEYPDAFEQVLLK